MNTVDSNRQFKYEFIAGVSLTHDLHRSNQIDSNIDTKKARQVPDTKLDHQPYPASPVLSMDKKRLEIIGSELGPKTSSHETNPQLFTKHTSSSLGPRFKLSRIDQANLQIPKRATFMAGRRAPENVLSRTWTSHVPFSPDLATSSKQLSTIPHRANTSTHSTEQKSIMVHRTQANPTLNASMTILKKMPTTTSNQISPRFFKKSPRSIGHVLRENSPIKLPTILKRTPSSIVKPIPSAYIQDSSRLQIPTSSMFHRPVLQPTPILPIYTPRSSVTLFAEQQHLPIIKERMIKANLAQRASFKCKSPATHRPDSSLSRSTTAVITASQTQIKTFNPLKHMDAALLLNEAARNRLKRLFHQLDTDRDGHLLYPQVQHCLPPNLPRAQETFFRVLYDITNEITYFGLQEFYTTAVLIELVAKQDPQIWNSLLDDVDFNYYRDDVLELLEEFDSRFSSVTATINVDSLVALIMARTSNGTFDRVTKELESLFPMIKTMKFTRLEFIVLIPVIIYIESRLDTGKSLFRFRENSILDSHMQKALLT